MTQRAEAPVDPASFALRSAADAVAELRRQVEATGAPGWSFSADGGAGLSFGGERDVMLLPLVLPDGQVVGMVRCPHEPTDHPADGPLRALLQIVVLLVALERRQQQAAGRAEAAERESRLDALTGLPNRRAWEEAVTLEQARCDRYGLQALVAVVDVDGLKEANDRGGHLAGDVLLRLTARALRAAVREADTVARLGGDEFAVLAVSWDDAERGAAGDFPERLAESLAAAGVSASVGVAVAEVGTRLGDAFGRADRSMYDAKRARKGAVR